MALVVNTNTASTFVRRQLTSTNDALNETIERLSSGLKINSAADDAAGLSVATGFETQASGNTVAKENAQLGVNMLQTAEGDMETIKDHLQSIRDLTVQAANGTYSDDERTMLKTEAKAHITEIDRVANSSKFNDINLLNTASNTIKLQIGADSGSNNQYSITFADCQAAALDSDLTSAKIDSEFATSDKANEYLDTVDNAIDTLSTNMSNVGTSQNILESVISNLDVRIQNIESSLSTIQDTDVAAEASNMTRLQILQSMQTTLLAQTNSSPSVVLNLL